MIRFFAPVLALLALLGLSQQGYAPGPMSVTSVPNAFTHIQGNTGTESLSTSCQVVMGANPTTGNLLVAGLTVASITAITVKDSNNNSYTETPNSAAGAWVFYTLSAAANATKTVNFAWTSGHSGDCFVDEFHFTGPAVTLDTDLVGSGSGTAVNTPSIAGKRGDLLYCVNLTGTGVTAPTGGGTAGVWTGVPTLGADGNMAEYVLGGAGTTACNMTQSSGGWNTTGAGFK